jgi:multidrug efflux pump subunit AcrB
MIITNMAIDRRTTVFVSLLLILIVGVHCYLVLPRESNPEIVIPIISVSTYYSGVAPADMESLITIPIERKLSGLADVKEIISTSSEGMSSIQIEFDTDMDIDTALQKVRDKVDLAKPDRPDDADDSMLQEINLSEFPIIFLSLTGEAQLPVLTQFAEDLEEELETVKGVLDVAVIGGAEREIQIIIDPDRASAYGVSMADLVTLALVENVNTPPAPWNWEKPSTLSGYPANSPAPRKSKTSS